MALESSLPASQAEAADVKLELNLKKLELAALLEITQAINNNLPEHSLYKIYYFTLLAQLNISRLTVCVLEDNWECKMSFGTSYDFKHLKALPDAITTISQITAIPALPLDARWQEFETVIPIFQHNKLLAIVLMGNTQAYYSDLAALSFVQTISNIFLVALQNRRLVRQRLAEEAIRNEMKIACQVQQMLLPKYLPNNKQVTVHASYLPHSSIGGDFYDYVRINQDQFLVCVADVSGKGVPASLLMSNFQAGLRTILRQTEDLVKVVRELNCLIYDNALGEKFISSFLGIFNCKTRELQYVNAGHNAPVMLLEDNSCQLLTEGCTMLGIFAELPVIKAARFTVPAQSMLLCYTDGLTEVFNQEEEEFSLENIISFLKVSRSLSPPKLHKALLAEVRNHNQGSTSFQDDITILSCQFK